MKLVTLSTAVAISLANTTATADFLGVTCEPYLHPGWIENGYAGLTTYRLYAEFTNPEDYVYAVVGNPGHPMVFEPSGGVFHNADIFDSLTAPLDLRALGIWVNQWDTYVTIGTDIAEGDQTYLSAGFGTATGYLTGSFSVDNDGWWMTFGHDQGYATDGRVLIGQMSVPCGHGVTGMVNVFARMDGQNVEHLSLPFECGPAGFADCNDNCLPDDFEIATGLSNDCDENGVPDKCDSEECLRADLNCSGDVGFDDLLQILGGWGPCSGCVQDMDDDGEVGFQEILFVLGHWGACGG